MTRPKTFLAGALVGIAVGALTLFLIGDVLSLGGFGRFALVILAGGAVAFAVVYVGERSR